MQNGKPGHAWFPVFLACTNRWWGLSYFKDAYLVYSVSVMSDSLAVKRVNPDKYYIVDTRGRRGTVPICSGPGYFWYSIGHVTLPERSFLAYATRKWTAQLPISLPGMNGNTFEVKALVKFTGPMFFEGSAEPNEIRDARLAYVEP